MSLLSLLLALSLERIRHSGTHWLWQASYHQLIKRLQNQSWPLQALLGIALPVALLVALQLFLQGRYWGLGSLLLWVAVPFLTLGCPPLQCSYRDYLRAAADGDQQACEHFNQTLLQGMHEHHRVDSGERLAVTTGTQLVWLNYRYYFAILFFFVLLGPAGAVFYACCRELHCYNYRLQPEHDAVWIHRLMHLVDWLPSRLAGLSYILVGNAASAAVPWLSALKDRQHSNGYWLAKVATAAEDIDTEGSSLCVETTTRYVSLAKRGMLLAIAILSLMTITGQVI
ncbi:regulatory signaling modulator protein AmpE [Aliagarivorans taiwanensis]|uniref:regulatory signaling modulator protein AmpE n=1 Tax=Aliagarivorans taiwanensis TaxID=561966 RepID=UPI0003F60586|nr:regulatory signaling modulator protein AmpE [Aliagarivorans taiwanensis]